MSQGQLWVNVLSERTLHAQMATLEKAEALLEELRAASWDAAVRDLAEVEVRSSLCVWRSAVTSAAG